MKRIVTMVLVALAFSVMSWAQEKADDWSVLIDAIATGNATGLREAIRAGRDLNAKDRETGQTPLHIAVAYSIAKSDTLSVELLLEAGADVNAVNSAGGTPLSYADKLNDLKTVRLLLRHGAKTDIPITQAGQTVLHSAAHAGHAETVRLLLEAKATVDVRSKSGQTPLVFAVSGSHKDVVSSLLGASADPNSKDESGLTPLFYGANNGDLAIVKILVNAGADPKARDPEGKTAADWATKKGHKDVATYLSSNLARQAKAKSAEVPVGTQSGKGNIAARDIVQLIDDSAMFKLLWADMNYNLVGVGGGEREKHATQRVTTIKKLVLKYGIPAEISWKSDIEKGWGGQTHPEEVGYVRIPNVWSEIIVLANAGRLPTVKFRNGKVVLVYTSVSIQYEEGTECMVKGREYHFQGGKWLQE